jgi:hypothetical protein
VLLPSSATEPRDVYLSFLDLTKLEDPSMTYYGGWDTGRISPKQHWCLIGEITNAESFMRPQVILQTRFGEEVKIMFYLDDRPSMMGFQGGAFDDFPFKVEPGHTICIMYAERKTFMDMSVGVRQETLGACWVFNAPFQEVQADAEKLLRPVSGCFHCGEVSADLRRCTRCRCATYCNETCQRAQVGVPTRSSAKTCTSCSW